MSYATAVRRGKASTTNLNTLPAEILYIIAEYFTDNYSYIALKDAIQREDVRFTLPYMGGVKMVQTFYPQYGLDAVSVENLDEWRTLCNFREFVPKHLRYMAGRNSVDNPPSRIDDITMLALPRHLQDQIKENLPTDRLREGIECLELCGTFDDSLETLPKTLKKLYFTNSYFTKDIVFPEGLEILDMEGCFNYEKTMKLPKGLKELRLGPNADFEELPESLLTLHLGENFNRKCEFPKNLEWLKLSTYFDKDLDNLPDSLEVLDISQLTVFSKRIVLPKNLKKIVVAHEVDLWVENGEHIEVERVNGHSWGALRPHRIVIQDPNQQGEVNLHRFLGEQRQPIFAENGNQFYNNELNDLHDLQNIRNQLQNVYNGNAELFLQGQQPMNWNGVVDEF